MPKTNLCIFLVEDDASVRRALKRLVRSFGYQVDAFASAREMLNTLSTAAPDCLIVDVQMPGLNGLGLQHHLAEAGHKLPIIFITAHEDAQVYQHAMEAVTRPRGIASLTETTTTSPTDAYRRLDPPAP